MTLALLLASLAASTLGTFTGLPAKVGQIINSITGALAIIFKNGAANASGNAVSIILATMQYAVSELKTYGITDPNVLADIQEIDNMMAAALAAHSAAGQSVDPAKLQPIAPIA